MRFLKFFWAVFIAATLVACNDDDDNDNGSGGSETSAEIQLGSRPFFLIDDMDDGELKTALQACEDGPFYKTDFSIGHRGAPLQYPEHTRESYIAAAKMGAGILECDVTFTQDRQLVCRHSQCDLHTTTNILATDLAENCTTPFVPANPDAGTPAEAMCCTSDITLAEFKTLKGKMETGHNPNATTVEEYLNTTPDWRTDLYSSRGTLLTHAESIALFQELGVKMTPELKSPSVEMPYEGEYTQENYAQQMIDEYVQAGVDPSNVWAQSFNLEDVLYWIQNAPDFGMQAVYLDGRYGVDDFDHNDSSTWSPTMAELVQQNVKVIAPPMWMLVTTDAENNIVPSAYAIEAKAAGLQIITWTLERSGHLASGGGWYYQSLANPDADTNVTINNDGDMYALLDVLAKDVGVIGIFTDWAATVTYYANCMDL